MNSSPHDHNPNAETLSPEQAQRLMLDGDWTQERLQSARQLLQAIDNDPQLQDALAEYDTLRAQLSGLDTEELTAAPEAEEAATLSRLLVNTSVPQGSASATEPAAPPRWW